MRDSAPETAGDSASGKAQDSEQPATKASALALSPQEFAARIADIKAEAADLTKPFADCTVETGWAGQHSFIDASCKGQVKLVFHFFKELDVPNTSACLLVPDWPNARFNHYLKGSELLKVFPAGALYRYPVKLVYLPARAGQLGSATDDSLTMTFQGLAAGYPARIAADSQASHVFVNPEWARRARVHVTPVRESVQLGDGSTASIIGRCSVKLSLGPFSDRITGLILASFSSYHDIILGEEFLSRNKAVLNYAARSLTLKRGARKFTVQSREISVSVPPRTKKQDLPVLSAMQAKRAMRKSAEEPFLVVVRDPTLGLDPEGGQPDPLDSLNSVGGEGAADAEQHIGDGPCDKHALRALLRKYAHVSPAELPGFPPDRGEGTQHVIQLVPGAQPPAPRRYRLSPRERQEVEDHVAKLLKKGFAQPSNSPFGAPILFVPKPDGSLRLVVDYRALNKLTIKDKYPLQRIDDLLDRLTGARVFSALDLTQGYYQLRIAPEDVPKTAFTTHVGLYEYKVLPMGLSNAPSAFQRAMDKIFRPCIDAGFVCVYLDDILIYSKTAEEHLQHLEAVFKVLEQNQLYIRMFKCTFNATEVKFLGHIVGNDQVKPDPKKVAAVESWAVPTNIHELRAFLGLVNYFSKYIEKHAALARPLTELLRKWVPFYMHTPERMGAFEALKKALTSAPVLALPDRSKPFKVIVDASLYDISGILLQGDRPVAYESRKLRPAECNYPTHEREMLAAIHCLKVWRCYLDGADFSLYTDHKPNLAIDTQPQLSARQVRWIQFISLFNFEWHWMEGKSNPADYLTRMPSVAMLRVLNGLQAGGEASPQAQRSQREKGQRIILDPSDVPVSGKGDAAAAAAGKASSKAPAESRQVKRAKLTRPLAQPATAEPAASKQTDGPLTGTTIQGQTPAELNAMLQECYAQDRWFQRAKLSQVFSCRDGLYYLHGKLVIPEACDLREKLIRVHHDPPARGHPGVVRTAELLMRSFWWPGLTTDVRAYVQCCHQCQVNKSKTVKPAGLLQPMPIPERRWESVGMDFIVGLPCSKDGYDSILVIIDRLSKYVKLVPTTTTVTAPEVARLFVDHVMKSHGCPKSIVSDRDKNFTSHFWQTVCELWQIEQLMSTAFHPQTDGQTERVNRVLEEYLRSYVNPLHDDWDQYLPMAEFAINNSKQASTGMSPFEMMYGESPYMPLGLADSSRECPAGKQFAENITKAVEKARIALADAQGRMKTYADSKRRDVSYSPGDLVLLSTTNLRLKVPGSTKLLPRYVGPFPVEQAIGKAAYKLALPSAMRIHPVFHVSLLHPYHSDGAVHPPPPLYFDDGLPFYEVEAVLQHREVRRGKRAVKHYLVKWKGYGHEHNTWEPEGNFNVAALQAFWANADQQQ